MKSELLYAGITGIAALLQPELAPFILLAGGLLFIFLNLD